LFTYPPAPATGGITVTNEDLFCLNEGEFLNDVIIDFYLKYLATEMYPEKFQNAHIFSSFFYRPYCVQTSQRSNFSSIAHLNASIQQRRHAHVRTWTRHVDLFSKDFVVVPVNESAHWFLAIICFPG
ncbi:hypothetical protein HELRODRAFT_143979, partial [Helobdella robusta]|uniref:Ubiquitin-like protease family profile domain-containing protein n=1 Tax=Helobdella robusta TaxID=6412 RepID=T1EJD2_HELRO